MIKKFSSTRKTVFVYSAVVLLAFTVLIILLHLLLGLDYHNLVLGALAIIDIVLIVVVIVEISELSVHRQVTENAMDSITGSVRLLERDKVYVYLEQTARNAERYVHHVSFAQSSAEIKDEEEKIRVNRFLSALETACRNLKDTHGGPDVKILGPDLSAKIGGLWERKIIEGCEVGVSPRVPSYDIRIQIVDDRNVVIGIAAPAKESERGFLIESTTLATTLNEMFMRVWDSCTSLEDSTALVVMRHVDTGITTENELIGLMQGSLNVASDRIAQEILKLLVETKAYLIRDGNQALYKTEILKLFQEYQQLTDEELKERLADNNHVLPRTSFAKFRDFVLKLNGGEPTAGNGVKKVATDTNTIPEEKK